MPDAGRLRGGLPHARAPGLWRRRRHVPRDGAVQLRYRRALQPLVGQLARRAGPAIGRSAVHRSQLPGPGRRRAHVERLRGDHAVAGLSELRRQARAGNQLPDDPEVAGLRGDEDQGPHPGALRQHRDPPAAMELPGRLGGAAATPAAETLRAIRSAARFINNCHYLYTLELAAKIAAVLGKPADAALYARAGGHAPAHAARAVLRRREEQLRHRRAAVPGVPAADRRGAAGRARRR